MKKSRAMLRQRFQAETDVEMDPQPQDWGKYAVWLEGLAVKELNNELVRENEFLRAKMGEAADVLEEGITGRYTKRTKKGTHRRIPSKSGLLKKKP